MADFCKTCKHCDTVEYDEPCFSCRTTGGGIPTKWEAKANCKPQTNADRIRAMSDEELAVLLADEIPHGDCYGCHLNCCNMDEDSCQNAWYGWLKQPAEE